MVGEGKERVNGDTRRYLPDPFAKSSNRAAEDIVEFDLGGFK